MGAALCLCITNTRRLKLTARPMDGWIEVVRMRCSSMAIRVASFAVVSKLRLMSTQVTRLCTLLLIGAAVRR